MPSTIVPSWDNEAPVPAPRYLVPRAAGAWFANNLMAERGRWALWLPVFMGAGIGVYFWLTVEPAYWIAPSGLALGAALCAAILRRPRFAGWLMPAAGLTVMCAGFGLAQLQTWLVAAPVIEHRLGPVEITGRLVSVDPLPEGTRLLIAPRSVERCRPARRRNASAYGCAIPHRI